jgi:hypothetical protein
MKLCIQCTKWMLDVECMAVLIFHLPTNLNRILYERPVLIVNG